MDKSMPLEMTSSYAFPKPDYSSREAAVSPSGIEQEGSVKSTVPPKEPLQKTEEEFKKPQAKDSAESQLNEEEVAKSIENLKAFIESKKVAFELSKDEKSGRDIVKILDKSGELIKQYPREDLLNMARKVQEYLETQQESNQGLTKKPTPQDEAKGWLFDNLV